MTTILAASPEQIRRYARGTLVAADALDRTPAPLDEINAAVGLLPPEALFEMGDDIPPGLMAKIRKLAGKVAGGLAFQEKTVYLDFSQPFERRRFTHGHEIGHGVLPWHRGAYFGDDQHTLHPDTRDGLEQESNAFAADLLFGLDRFIEQADSFAPGIGVPLSLNDVYAVSAHASLRRYGEGSRRRVAVLALGRYPVSPGGKPALKVMTRQCAESTSFLERYGPIAEIVPPTLEVGAYPLAAAAAQLVGTGVGVAPSEITLDTRRGRVRFDAELFSNGHLRFVLLYRRPAVLGGRRIRAVAA